MDPRLGLAWMGKQDVDNSFYQMQLAVEVCLALALLLPQCADEPQLVGTPMGTTMGWVQSPPTFCTMSETVCDLANDSFKAKLPAPDH
jgi:hypothetical protein